MLNTLMAWFLCVEPPAGSIFRYRVHGRQCSLRFAAGHSDLARSRLMAAMSSSIPPSSRINRRLVPGGPAKFGRHRNAAAPIRNCRNSRMARDLIRTGRAHNSGREPRRPRRAVRLQVLRRATPQSLRVRRRRQTSSSSSCRPETDRGYFCQIPLSANRHRGVFERWRPSEPPQPLRGEQRRVLR